MNWKNLFVPVRSLAAAEAEKFMAGKKPGEYQLLDVRQPKEYEAGHLPGSLLIPLQELPERLGELDREKPVLVYCAVGGRSRAAAQLLAGRDFTDVVNMAGGIRAWEGHLAKGPEEAGLELLVGDKEYDSGMGLAYAMEEGLQGFYRFLAERTAEGAEKSLYLRLMGFEDRHKARLLAEYQAIYGQGEIPARGNADIMEGGGKVQDFLGRVKVVPQNKREILDLAMMLETQALDLYSRIARKSETQGARDFFSRMAEEEGAHLSFLAAEMDNTL